MSDAAEVRVVSVGSQAPAGTTVWLVVPAEGGDCAIAAGHAVEGGVAVGPVGAARAAWLGDRVRASTVEVAACAGLPPIAPLLVPLSGAAVGVRGAVSATDVTGPFAVTAIGGEWWEVRPTAEGHGTLVFAHADAPPTAFEAATDPGAPAPAATVVRVAVGGVAVRPGAPVTFVDLGPDPVATVVAVGGATLVLGRAPGVADGLWRVRDEVPEPIHIEVAGAIPAGGEAIVVPVGGHRVRRPDLPVTEALVADERVARAAVDRGRLRIDGLAPGRTEIALESPDGVRVIAVTVGY